MRLIRGLSQLSPFAHGCVLTIGNFDGVHYGHQRVIQKLAERGSSLGLPVVVMIFEPQPLEYFLKENEPSRLSSLRDKALQLARLPVDAVVVVKFNRQFANYEAEHFIQNILLKKLNVKHLVIGDDFHFGKARRGNFALLKERGKQYGFSVEDTGSLQIEGQRVSSTLIRDALNAGDLRQAKSLLGRDYAICGRVAHGNKLGRSLGYPTANIKLFRENTPINGVFAVTMTGIDDLVLQGVANVGTRPTIDGGSKVILETHLFDFNQDIYGRYVEVHFQQKIRDELRFANLTQLQAQIVQDVSVAKTIFANNRL
jgi:riboflavin kinase/FMN adenylyltransferase